MSPEGYAPASGAIGIGDRRRRTAEKLQDKPTPQNDQGRQPDKGEENDQRDQGQDAGGGIEKKICSHDPRDRPTGSHAGNGRIRVECDMRERCG